MDLPPICPRRDAELAARGLPELAFQYQSSTGVVVTLRGRDGHFVPVEKPRGASPAEAATWVAAMNARLGVSEAQREAMFVGSAFGWDVPGADPKTYGERS